MSSTTRASSFARAAFHRRVVDFFETPQSPEPLGFFRIALAGFALLQAAVWYPDWMAFFGPEGWLQWEISLALNTGLQIHIQHVHEIVRHLGLRAEQTVMVFFWCYAASLVGLLVGWHTRIWAVLAYLCHYIIMCTASTFVYGVDIFLQISLFYLMLMPVARAYSLDARQGRVTREASWGVTFSRRVLQIHMCIVYLSAGSEKALSVEWWSGNALWRSLVQPDFRQFDLTWLADWAWIPMLLSWFIIVVETGYCVGMWVPRLRVLWLAGIVSLHLGIGLFLGLWLFGLVMILLSLSAFGREALADIRRLVRP